MNRIEQDLQRSFSFSDDASTGFFVADAFVQHDRFGHPESPSRLLAIANETVQFKTKLNLRPMEFEFEDFSSESVWLKNLSEVHDRSHLESLFRKLDQPDFLSGSRWSPYGGSFAKEAVFKATVGTSEIALAVARGQIQNGFALVRPPGHHAGRDFSEGYCLVNNIALAAKRVTQLSHKPVVILDLDVHHGNGTENIFYDSSEVTYISLHQDEWPSTGEIQRVGSGQGRGHNFNLALPIGSDGTSWLRAFDKFAVPAIEKVRPFMILVSMGFDTHWRDPQGSMLLSTLDQLALTARVRKLAEKICAGRLLFVLEGGYDRRATAAGILNTLADLAGAQDGEIVDPYGSSPRTIASGTASRVDEAVSLALKTHGL